MNLELTMAQHSALFSAILPRIRQIETLIEGWKTYPNEYTDFLIQEYTKEMETLKEFLTLI